MSLCSEAHIAPPEALGHCIAALNAPDGRTPGAAADLLSKLVRMLAEVQARWGGGGVWGRGRPGRGPNPGLGLAKAAQAPKG
jgi:hypothetical protein